ncbi:DNA-binding MarR family transcriptional regulator [Rhodococcus sp. LBL1]|uniref:DNA-binding MarR family transcriptional regulator n=1 Tax=Prescottella agglutinans TaxID=1644129 RepID=A0ABT6MDY1_9NOCA|nr:MarR family transcriptional regulator [Prescottella agglutinans]MDH6282527.1 DNA-binding MarR family transcriptional regulator [Prescottella agglutinans]MDH6679131.1 DNA-binding MarR family transcriptional regulator [Rhodococcus sp. LBL1]MDH6685129.1 DNA-binding MarR family transcriptional regulator [Rhodococcus sp. LBL2]
MTSLFDDDEVSRLRVALGRISRQVDRQTSGGELTKTQFSILTTAVRRGPIRASEMAEIETLNPTMLSRMIGKMEAAGLLQRSAHPDDGRAVVVAATPEGIALHSQLRDKRTRLFAEYLTQLPETKTQDLLDALPALEGLADQMCQARATTRS